MKSTARSLALLILNEVLLKGKFASNRIDYFLKKENLKAVDQALMTHIVYGVLRQKAFLDFVIITFLKTKKTPPIIQNILCLAVYQIFYLEKVPDHAVVSEAVKLAKFKGGAPMGGLVNAILRRVLENRETFLEKRRQAIVAFETRDLEWALSIPAWLLKRWSKRYSSKQILNLVQRINEIPPTYLRVNTTKINVEEISRQLKENGIHTKRVIGTPILKLDQFPKKALSGLFQEGVISVQDLASWRVVEALNAGQDEIGLDVCCGHGGKTSAVIEKYSNSEKIYIHDSSKKQLKELSDNFKRLRLHVPVFVSSPDIAKKRKLQFDWILVDAPCSGLGTLGRKPEIRWRVKPENLKKHAKQQLAILESWLPTLKKKGRILYSVCSLEPEEGEEVIEEFQKRHDGLKKDFSFTTFPSSEQQDGFYVCQLIKVGTD